MDFVFFLQFFSILEWFDRFNFILIPTVRWCFHLFFSFCFKTDLKKSRKCVYHRKMLGTKTKCLMLYISYLAQRGYMTRKDACTRLGLGQEKRLTGSGSKVWAAPRIRTVQRDQNIARPRRQAPVCVLGNAPQSFIEFSVEINRPRKS